MWYKGAQFLVQEYNPGGNGNNNNSIPPYTPPNGQSQGQYGQGQQGQQNSQNQPQSQYEQMMAAMKEGRMPIRNSDGSVGYLEKGLWSLQPPAGYGYFPYQATYANGATQQVYLSKQELNQGTQTNAGNPQTLLSQKGGEANSYAVIQEDQSTYVVLPANLCTHTSAPMGAGWYQYQGMNGQIVYGAGPEDQTARSKALADAKANPQQQTSWQQYLNQQFAPYMNQAIQQSQNFNNAYNQMMANQAQSEAQARGQAPQANPHQHGSNGPSRGRHHT